MIKKYTIIFYDNYYDNFRVCWSYSITSLLAAILFKTVGKWISSLLLKNLNYKVYISINEWWLNNRRPFQRHKFVTYINEKWLLLFRTKTINILLCDYLKIFPSHDVSTLLIQFFLTTSASVCVRVTSLIVFIFQFQFWKM